MDELRAEPGVRRFAFLYENVVMSQPDVAVITDTLGVEPIFACLSDFGLGLDTSPLVDRRRRLPHLGLFAPCSRSLSIVNLVLRVYNPRVYPTLEPLP